MRREDDRKSAEKQAISERKNFMKRSLFSAGLAAQEMDHAANGEIDRCGNAVLFPQRYHGTVERVDLGGLVRPDVLQHGRFVLVSGRELAFIECMEEFLR